MPAKNPRLTITMRPGLHALLRRLSELTGQSQSALIFELLDGSEPVLSRVIRLLEASNDARAELHGHLAGQMADAQSRIERQLALSLDDLGEDAGALLAEADAVQFKAAPGAGKRRAAAAGKQSAARVSGAPQGRLTPPSNRGVRSRPDVPKKSTKSRG